MKLFEKNIYDDDDYDYYYYLRTWYRDIEMFWGPDGPSGRRGYRGNVGQVGGLDDLEGLFQPWWFYNSMTAITQDLASMQ